MGKNLINKAKKEELCVVLKTGHRVNTQIYSAKGELSLRAGACVCLCVCACVCACVYVCVKHKELCTLIKTGHGVNT